MAITKAAAASSNYVARIGYGDFPDNTGDWTIFVQFKYIGTPATYVNVLSLFNGSSLFGGSYVFLGNENAATDELNLSVYNGTDFNTTTSLPIVNGDWNWLGVTYIASSGTFELIVNGTSIDSYVVNVSAITWDRLFLLGDASAGAPEPISVAYCRAWNHILSVGDMMAEAASITPTITTGLIWDCPSQASIDLTSHNNTLNQLSATGTVTTDTDDPLLSVVAGPPTNTTPATAITIDTDSAYFQDTLTGGAATRVWYKYTAVTGDNEIGFCAFGDLVTYKPTTNPFDGITAANAGTPDYLGTAGVNRPFQIPVTVGNTYYFRVSRNAAVTPATVQVSLVKGLDLTVPAGSLAINDDTSGFPLVFLDVNTGYPIKFIQDFPVSEGAGILNTGIVLTTDENDDDAKLLDTDYTTVLASVAVSGSSLARISSNYANKFLHGVTLGGIITTKLRLIDSNGVLDPTIFDLGLVDAWAIGLNNNSTIAYYVALSANQPIKAWDLVNNVALSNLVAAFGATQSVGKDILVLGNGSILVLYINGSTRDVNILAYNAAGSTLHTYALGIQGVSTNGNDNRLAFALDDPNSFWAWIRDAADTSRFVNIKFSDGSLLTNLTGIVQYEGGQYQLPPTNTPVRFGHSESCPFWITGESIAPINNAKSGLYILSGTGSALGTDSIAGGPDSNAGPNTVIRHDTDWIDTSAGTSEDVEIPDPYYDTYLAGDE